MLAVKTATLPRCFELPVEADSANRTASCIANRANGSYSLQQLAIISGDVINPQQPSLCTEAEEEMCPNCFVVTAVRFARTHTHITHKSSEASHSEVVLGF